jgi:hypothetical protein
VTDGVALVVEAGDCLSDVRGPFGAPVASPAPFAMKLETAESA